MAVNKGELREYDSEIRELLVGTWVTIGIVADSLAETGDLDRDSMFALLVRAEADGRERDRRYVAIGAVRRILESLDAVRQETVPLNRRTRCRSSTNRASRAPAGPPAVAPPE